GNQASFDAVALLEAEQTAGHLYEGDRGPCPLLPAHQQSPCAIEPAVPALDGPPAWSLEWLGRPGACAVLPAWAEVGNEAAPLGRRAWQIVGVARVQAQMLRLRVGRRWARHDEPTTSPRRAHDERLQRGRGALAVRRVRSGDHHGER